MARSINKVILVGYLGIDPGLRYTPAGTPVCKLRLATSERFTDAEGNLLERTEWHNLVVWNRLAEVANQYLRKGSKIYVEGKLRTRSYEKDGQAHYVTEVYVSDLVMLDRPVSTGDGSGSAAAEQVEVKPARATTKAASGKAQTATAEKTRQVRRKLKEQFDAAPEEPEEYGFLEPDDDLPF